VFHDDNVGDTVEGVADLQPEPAEPAEASQPSVAQETSKSDVAPARRRRTGNIHRCGAPKADGSGPCPANVAGPDRRCPFHDDSPEGKARMALARQQGGKAPRVRLGLDNAVVDGITLADSEGQLQVLTAATKALALGAISSTTATAISQLVRAASAIVQSNQQAAIAELEAKLDTLIMEAPRGRR